MIGCRQSGNRSGYGTDNGDGDHDPGYEALHHRRQAVIGIHEQAKSLQERIDQSGEHIAHRFLDISPGIGILQAEVSQSFRRASIVLAKFLDQIGYPFGLEPGIVQHNPIAAQHSGMPVQCPTHEIKGGLHTHSGGFVGLSEV
ncbi:MAG: hypothetical protein BWY95_01552 [Bacteroidetes bacterium ADurb.BinA104]|nr:MAG: hypothetical protein BWY95_01552 [Bacteroidetes bacterium ADurb.BinA104]